MTRSNKKKPIKILWIDDDENVLDFCCRTLRAHGAEVQSAESGMEGLQILMDNDMDVVVSDLEMVGLDGLEVATKVNEMFSESPRKKPAFVILTAWVRDMSSEDIAEGCFVDAILEKPIEMRQLLKTIDGIMAARNS